MIKTLKPRLAPMPQRLKSAREVRDRRYSPDAKVRGWYKSKRWRELRLAVLERDLWTCQQTGVLLIGKPPADNSPIVHHKTPHKGDERLFWDQDNLQAVSKAWHDAEAQSAERNSRR